MPTNKLPKTWAWNTAPFESRMGFSGYQILERIDELTSPEGVKRSLVITKSGKYLRGPIVEHNVRVSSDGRVRGRIVMTIDSTKKEIESGDIASVEEMK